MAKLPSISIERIHDVRAIDHGAHIEIDITLASGARKRLLLSFDKAALAARALLVGHYQATLQQHAVGKLDLDNYSLPFQLAGLDVKALSDQIAVAVRLVGGGILPVAFQPSEARDAARVLLDAADEIDRRKNLPH
jgi:hypothetical protein